MTAEVLRSSAVHNHFPLTMKRSGKDKKASPKSIAPRYQKPADTKASDPYAPSSLNLPRPRLPPRSRFGCWTCRTRKVKCDEARPECTPCSRLGHKCDYNPRLAFKDDTPRVIEKISGRSGGQGPAWQSTGSYKRQRLDALEDVLPPFASLTTDDDRERKAQFQSPGTYNVIVNPDSFMGLDEYRETFPEASFPPRRQSYAGPSLNVQYIRRITRIDTPVNSFDEFEEINDPDIVVLKVFEDDHLTSLSPAVHIPRTARSSQTGATSSVSDLPQHPVDNFQVSLAETPLMRFAHPDGRDHSVIYYYKNFVHRHLGQVHRDSLGTPVETGALSAPDVFETQAARFLPLYHALMAFSALSMSHNHCSPCVEALCHYQQALPLLQASLHTEEDLASDGVFLTHFILLLYEIAAGEARGLSLWNQHISQLQRIILLRKHMYGNEPYTFIVWWVASIDTHVVLSGMGDGSFCETMLRQNLLPTGIESETPSSPFSKDLVPDLGALPSSLAFHRRIMVVAAELGLLTRDLREESRQLSPDQPSLDTIRHWQARISTLQDTLRRAWNVQMPASVASGYCNQLLPVGARGIFEHSFALYRALLIYSHTSVYPTQRLHHPSHTIHEVSRSAGEILRLGREIVGHSHTERKFIVFPLFMAGFANRHRTEREEILALIKNMEVDSIGRNGVAARQLLEVVYERQDRRRVELRRERKGKGVDAAGAAGVGAAAVHSGEGAEDVDWVGMIAELGLQVVNCRL